MNSQVIESEISQMEPAPTAQGVDCPHNIFVQRAVPRHDVICTLLNLLQLARNAAERSWGHIVTAFVWKNTDFFTRHRVISVQVVDFSLAAVQSVAELL